MDSWHNYNINLDEFKFCVKKKCPLRKTCFRKVKPPFNSEYYVTGGKYDKTTKSCALYININYGKKI